MAAGPIARNAIKPADPCVVSAATSKYGYFLVPGRVPRASVFPRPSLESMHSTDLIRGLGCQGKRLERFSMQEWIAQRRDLFFCFRLRRYGLWPCARLHSLLDRRYPRNVRMATGRISCRTHLKGKNGFNSSACDSSLLFCCSCCKASSVCRKRIVQLQYNRREFLYRFLIIKNKGSKRTWLLLGRWHQEFSRSLNALGMEAMVDWTAWPIVTSLPSSIPSAEARIASGVMVLSFSGE